MAAVQVRHYTQPWMSGVAKLQRPSPIYHNLGVYSRLVSKPPEYVRNSGWESCLFFISERVVYFSFVYIYICICVYINTEKRCKRRTIFAAYINKSRTTMFCVGSDCKTIFRRTHFFIILIVLFSLYMNFALVHCFFHKPTFWITCLVWEIMYFNVILAQLNLGMALVFHFPMTFNNNKNTVATI